MNDAQRALRGLSDERFAAFVAEVVAGVWPDSAAEVSPPSPDGGVDVTLRRDDGAEQFLHVRRYPASSRVGATPVRDAADLAERRNYGAVTVATTSEFGESAREMASERGVELLDGADLVRMAVEAGVELPTDASNTRSEAEVEETSRLVGTWASYWPEELVDRARGVVDSIDAIASFDRRVVRSDSLADLDFVLPGSANPVVKVRFAETSLLVYVRDGATFSPAVRLTAYRERQPSRSAIDDDLRPAVRRALDETRRDDGERSE